MLEKIEAPFTQEQVQKLNEYQRNGRFHPFTCCSPSDIIKCERAKLGNGMGGLLIATKEGWVCPCGGYKQNWSHSFMAE